MHEEKSESRRSTFDVRNQPSAISNQQSAVSRQPSAIPCNKDRQIVIIVTGKADL
jgi:uncharacterized protein (UPF0218 family)